MKPLSIVRTIVLSFSLLIVKGFTAEAQPTRGPYLQSGTQTSIVIHWKTSTSVVGRVRYSTTYAAGGNYASFVDQSTAAGTDHIVTITGLTADTKYYYSIGTSAAVLQSGTDHYFRTLPPANTTRKMRFVVFGDCGRNTGANSGGFTGVNYNDQSMTQYNATLAGWGEAPDAWILLGDNAYDAGTDAEYTARFFGIYGATILRNHKLYPVPGNHDYSNSGTIQDNHLAAYYTIFDLPTTGQAGGVASNKEEYYSYDIGNVHFIALDAYGEESNKRFWDLTSPQSIWLQADLAANTKQFTIAYWHHGPYTMGSHNSDSEGDLVSVRTGLCPIMEAAGVDVVICGHSHNYERSRLMKGHYGLEATFSAGTHNMSTSDAKYTSNTTCPYTYPSSPKNHGTVYITAGSTGASGNTQGGYPHNALPFAVNDGGYVYIEVQGNRLDLKFQQRTGTIFDNFTIIKDKATTTTNFSIQNGTSVDLTASWPQSGSYTWTGTGASGTTKTISVTPPSNAVTNYTVTDGVTCLTDNFSVTTSNILPVSLTAYDVVLKADKKVYVTWTTASETNNKYFTVERSVNAIDFTAIGTVNGAVNSTSLKNYSFIDPLPLSGKSYYRLSQTNLDDHKEYMAIKRVDNGSVRGFEVKTVSTYNNTLALQINTTESNQYRLMVYDISGRKWKDEVLTLSPGTIRKEISLSPGMYVWEVRNEKGEAVQQKVSIQ